MRSICADLHQLCTHLPLQRFPIEEHRVASNGIYLLFEDGELAHGVNRVVRVGTHTGRDQLRSRLKQHFVKENKDRSIFRKNIGRALLNKAKDPFLEQWNWDLTTSKAKQSLGLSVDRDKQAATERAVSQYIQGHFAFIAFRVDDKEQRLFWESKLISTISRCSECGPSAKWLGLDSPIEKIRESGMWLVNELYREELSAEELRILSRIMTG